MPHKSNPAVKPPISDTALKVRTGRDWAQWCKELDAAGAADMSHGDIAKLVETGHRAGGWYSQTITVGYERLRGLREVNQKLDGTLQASASKTLPVAVATAVSFYIDPRKRSRWLKQRIMLRKTTSPNSVRIAWPDGTAVEVWIVAKGKEKCSVAVEHSGLPDVKSKDFRKQFWKSALERLSAALTVKKPARKKAPATVARKRTK